MTWKEVIRRLTAAGFVEQRTGKGSHRIYIHPTTEKRVVVTMHGHDAGHLGNRLLREAGIDPARKP